MMTLAAVLVACVLVIACSSYRAMPEDSARPFTHSNLVVVDG